VFKGLIEQKARSSKQMPILCEYKQLATYTYSQNKPKELKINYSLLLFSITPITITPDFSLKPNVPVENSDMFRFSSIHEYQPRSAAFSKQFTHPLW